jgi:hypothetical protein
MMLITKNRTLRMLVEGAYARAAVREEELLVVWNARIQLKGNCVIMESACPIYLDKVVEQLRCFTGVKPTPPSHFVWVRSRRKGTDHWRVATHRPAAPATEPAREAALRGSP